MNDLSQQISIRGKDGVSAVEFFSELLQNIYLRVLLTEETHILYQHSLDKPWKLLPLCRKQQRNLPHTHVSSRLTSFLDTYVGQAFWTKLYSSSL